MLNQSKTLLLLGLLTTGLLAIGGMLGPGWLIGSLLLAVVLNVGGYFFSDRLVLRMHRAVEMDRQRFQRLHVMTEELARNAGVPTPRLYLIPADYPNAFATGRNPQHGVVAVTEGLCRLLNDREIRGVIAHEIAHIRNRDVLIATIAAMIAAAITYIANALQLSALFGSSDDEEAPSPFAALAFAVVVPVGAALVQMGISRSREYLADAYGAQISGDPRALASALQKLTTGRQEVLEQPSPAAASLFIVNPLHGGIANWFSTHPPAEERIDRLLAMASGMSRDPDAAVQGRPFASARFIANRSRWAQGRGSHVFQPNRHAD